MAQRPLRSIFFVAIAIFMLALSGANVGVGAQQSPQQAAQGAKPPVQRKPAAARRPPALNPEDINRRTDELIGPKSQGAAVIRAQILLAQAHFSPGEIELAYNQNLKAALMAFQTAHGLEPTGNVDAETWQALESREPVQQTTRIDSESAASEVVQREVAQGKDAQGKAVQGEAAQGLDNSASPSVVSNASPDSPSAAAPDAGAPVLTLYQLTKEDVAGTFTRMPRARNAEELMLKKATLPRLGYSSALERLGEKFHISPKLLTQMNRRKNLTRVGTEILVPVLPPPLTAKADLVIVDASDRGVTALNEEGLVLAFYPATMGSEHDPLPLGNWKINGVERMPKFHYDPRLFWDAKNKNARAILPPGPNSPVGTVWIDLSKEHYGIHGTPEPGLIGKTESHGCIRLTNWDAEELANMVRPGLGAILQE